MPDSTTRPSSATGTCGSATSACSSRCWPWRSPSSRWSPPGAEWRPTALVIAVTNIAFTAAYFLLVPGPWLESPTYVAKLWPGALVAVALAFAALGGQRRLGAAGWVTAATGLVLVLWAGRWATDLSTTQGLLISVGVLLLVAAAAIATRRAPAPLASRPARGRGGRGRPGRTAPAERPRPARHLRAVPPPGGVRRLRHGAAHALPDDRAGVGAAEHAADRSHHDLDGRQSAHLRHRGHAAVGLVQHRDHRRRARTGSRPRPCGRRDPT